MVGSAPRQRKLFSTQGECRGRTGGNELPASRETVKPPAGSGLRGFSFISVFLRSGFLVILSASEGAGLDDPHLPLIIP